MICLSAGHQGDAQPLILDLVVLTGQVAAGCPVLTLDGMHAVILHSVMSQKVAVEL